MPEEFLHLKKTEVKKDFSIFLLIIPSLIFVLTMVYFFTKLTKYSPTAFTLNENTAVLGESSENP